jgi:hypothetical protein
MLRGLRALPAHPSTVSRFGASMTLPEHTPAPDLVVESADANTSPTGEKPAIPAFRFPFKPGELAQAKKDQPRYKGPGKSNHDKRPGAAPSGTRRSMGKR